MGDKYPFKIYGEPEFQNSALIVCWIEDASKLGEKVFHYLNSKLVAQELGEIEPADFFPLGGISIEDDIAQFPESKFYYSRERNLVIFKSNPPRHESDKFLNSVLDVAEHYCQAKELYTIGGMISLSPHTVRRELVAISNSPEMKKSLAQYDLVQDMNYETPPGQRPTLSTFLLWVAQKRKIAGASLWVSMPFYLAAVEDPQAWRKMLDFFDKRFSLGIDFRDIDEEVAKQNEKIAQVRNRFPELDDYISRLESNLSLTEQENNTLIRTIEELLRKRE